MTFYNFSFRNLVCKHLRPRIATKWKNRDFPSARLRVTVLLGSTSRVDVSPAVRSLQRGLLLVGYRTELGNMCCLNNGFNTRTPARYRPRT